MLIITNGDGAIARLRDAGFDCTMLPWRDVLHDGPAPGGLSLPEFSNIRAQFIASLGWGNLKDITEGFRQRDEKLAGFCQHDETVLWFEHDLYDQLQMLQLLEWFDGRRLDRTRLTLICRDSYISESSTRFLVRCFDQRKAVTSGQLKLGSLAWRAFCAPNPEQLGALIGHHYDALPYLAAALLRFVEEYPHISNGLARSQKQILTAVASGANRPSAIFEFTQNSEEAKYLGDWSLWRYIAQLAGGPNALLELNDGGFFQMPKSVGDPGIFNDQRLAVSENGARILAGQLDLVAVNGIDKWLGGVHLQPGHLWRWDGVRKRIVAD